MYRRFQNRRTVRAEFAEQSELNKTIIKKIGLYHQNILKKEYKGKSAELFEKKVDMI